MKASEFRFPTLAVFAILARVIPVLFAGVGVAVASPTQMNDVPAEVKDPAPSRDFAQRDVMIPMRDGVKLHTLIFVPNGAKDAPILMNRTPYFRGRYRDSFAKPSAIPANKPTQVRFDLPNVNHVFQPGHRIMVQIQSTLFPLYDRNPQTFVPNIFNARPADYRKADVTILRSRTQATAIVLPVVN